MKYFSTRDAARHGVDLKTALLRGLAPDGGLYLPESIPTLSHPPATESFPALAEQLALAWFGEAVNWDALRTIMRESYDFPVPIVPVGDRHICELFHGPSLSFKDVAAQFFARLLDHLLARDDERAIILTATSGDTGSAVAAACHGRKRLRAVILYPKGRISPTQEQQITTWGGNVMAVAVHGTFDDCQHVVKSALATSAISNVHLTSANSINIGRLLPQTFYYWWITVQHPRATIVVPSGNFGNLTAGVLAKRMGAPITRFVAATNINDAVPRYLARGSYDPHAAQHTLSNAMDVGAPSNFERLRHLYNDDVTAMQREIAGVVVTDEETRSAIATVHQQHGYFLDPHTAVAWCASQPSDVILATAHPAKFPGVITPITGTPPVVHPALAACDGRQRSVRELPEPTGEGLLNLLQRDFS